MDDADAARGSGYGMKRLPAGAEAIPKLNRFPAIGKTMGSACAGEVATNFERVKSGITSIRLG
jgi:hypothetical protein